MAKSRKKKDEPPERYTIGDLVDTLPDYNIHTFFIKTIYTWGVIAKTMFKVK